MSNRLRNEPSPYLRQHAENPVDWFPWGDEALQKARDEDKLIFLSVGYSSCHWCHVMERESFEDEGVAQILNRDFVSIKVDREERPDIDAVYMEAVQMMSGQGGWPMSVWLTPDLVPVFGGTYFPPEPRHGRPSFRQILNRLTEVYQNNRESVDSQKEKIKQALRQDLLSQLTASKVQDSAFSVAAENHKQQFDEVDGGFSSAPKFPHAMGISFLIRFGNVAKSEKPGEMALFSLSKMARGGIYDQIGGGFHRYSVDGQWLVPHFEKMLYDNALLLGALTDAWLVGRDSEYKRTVEQTIGFLNREMRHENGGYFSALDADSEGEEGKFYVWNKKEITETLGPEQGELFCRVFNVSEEGNWEGVNILHRSGPVSELAEAEGINEEELLARVDEYSKALLDIRAKRVRPGLDDKIITSWNAMLLKSLCRAGKAFNRSDWKEQAVQLAEFLTGHLLDENGVRRFWKDGPSHQPGFLDDTALLAEALVHVFEITGDITHLETADRLCRTLMDDYYDAHQHGFYFTSEKHQELISRNRDLFDNAVPSGNSAAIAALWHCGSYTGNTQYLEAADKSTQKLISTAGKHAVSFGYFLDAAFRAFSHKSEAVVACPPKTRLENTTFEASFVNEIDLTRLECRIKTNTETEYTPLAGKNSIDGKPTCYYCENFTCQAPVTE